MMQEFITALIVIGAAFVVVRRYAPKSLKKLARIGGVRLCHALGLHALAARIAQQAQDGASCGDGCGSCGNCASDAPKTSASISVDELKQTIRR